MALSGQSGGSNEDRANEAIRILEMLTEAVREQMTQKEFDFVEDMNERVSEYGSEAFVSPKQLFWLRDIKDKHL